MTRANYHNLAASDTDFCSCLMCDERRANEQNPPREGGFAREPAEEDPGGAETPPRPQSYRDRPGRKPHNDGTGPER